MTVAMTKLTHSVWRVESRCVAWRSLLSSSCGHGGCIIVVAAVVAVVVVSHHCGHCGRVVRTQSDYLEALLRSIDSEELIDEVLSTW
jgi:hypothetical protein